MPFHLIARSAVLVWVAAATLVPGLVTHAQGVEELLGATCKIANPTSTATGFLVNASAKEVEPATDALLVTAAHVFDQASGNAVTLIARKAGPDESFVRLELPFTIRADGRPQWVKHPTADVAVLRVKLPAECVCRPLPLAWISGEARPNDDRFQTGASVRLLTYPAQLASSDAGFPILRTGIVASFPLRPLKQAPTFLVDSSAFGGDSGGPVFLPGGVATAGGPPGGKLDPVILGLVSGQHRQTETVRTAYEERVIHHSLGLAIVVQGALIRETIGEIK